LHDHKSQHTTPSIFEIRVLKIILIGAPLAQCNLDDAHISQSASVLKIGDECVLSYTDLATWAERIGETGVTMGRLHVRRRRFSKPPDPAAE